jgi:hypothetical protein
MLRHDASEACDLVEESNFSCRCRCVPRTMSPMPPALLTPTGPSIWLLQSADPQEASLLQAPRLSRSPALRHSQCNSGHGLLGTSSTLRCPKHSCGHLMSLKT